MFKSKAVNCFFISLIVLVLFGEANRMLNGPKEEIEIENIPSKIFKDGDGFIFPIPEKSRKNLIGYFGDQRGNRKHQGIDVAAKRGTPVVAITNGEITKVKEGGRGGKQVWMKDLKNEYTFYYAHLNSQSVEVGQNVKQGDELGTVGSTGNAPDSAPHLHFEIIKEGRVSIDPLQILP